MIDTGIFANHTDVRGRVIGGWSSNGDPTDFSDCNRHGTHVAATAMGNSSGIAKAARVYAVKVGGCGRYMTLSSILRGIVHARTRVWPATREHRHRTATQ